MTDNKNNKNDNLEDLFKEVSDSSKNDSQAKSSLIKKQKDRKIWPYIATGVVLIGLGVGGYATYPKWSSMLGFDNAKTEQTDSNKNDSKDKDNEDSDSSKELTQEEQDNKVTEALENTKDPIETEKWTKIPYYERLDKDAEALQTEAIAWAEGTPFISFASMLPSRADGYTDDVKKATNEDGSPNMNYSYQTKENVEYNFAMYMNRLLNPMFGSWISIPTGPEREDAFPDDSFKDMFTEEWWDANIKDGDHSKLPIYLDWKNDNYGGLELESPWYGEIKVISATGEGDEENQGVNIDISADVEFTAIQKGGKKVTRTGTLNLQLVPNKKDDNLEHRNLINKATLTVNP